MSTARRRVIAFVTLLALLLVVVALQLRHAGGRSPGPANPAAAPESAARQEGAASRAHVQAAQPALATCAVRVVVTDADGRPIRDAVVAVFAGPDHPRWDSRDLHPTARGPDPERMARTDAEGAARFDLAGGRWFVTASARGYALRQVNCTAESGALMDEIAIALLPAVPFGGTIRGPEGPAEGVHVVLVPTFETSSWPADAGCPRATTDAEGVYHFDALAPGEYRLWYSPAAGTLVAADRIRVPALDRYDIHLAAGAEIVGTVRDLDTGEPVADAQVLAVDSASSGVLAAGRSDVRGQFAMRTWTEAAEVGHLVVDDPRVVSIRAPDGELRTDRSLHSGDRIECSLYVRRSATIHGTVRGPDGPAVGVWVQVVPHGDPPPRPGQPWGSISTVTGPRGEFRIEGVAPGVALLFVRLDRYDRVAAADQIALAAGETVRRDVTLQLVRRRATGRVVDVAGAPVADVVVAQQSGLGSDVTTTARDGSFVIDLVFPAELEGLGPANHDRAYVTLRHRDFLPAVERVELGEGRRAPIVLRRRVDLSGRVLAPTGSGARLATVSLVYGEPASGGFLLQWPGETATVTRRDGSFRLSVSDARFWCVRARGWEPTEGRDEPWGLERELEPMELRLPARDRIRGRVVDAEGTWPVADALVHEILHAHELQRTSHGPEEEDVVIGRTRTDGTYDVACGGDALRFSRVGHLDRRVVGDPALGDVLDVELSRAYRITGTVRMADGTPVAAAWLQATHPQHSGLVHGETDAHGRFVLRDVAPGVSRLFVASSDRSARPVTLEVQAGATDVEVTLEPAELLQVAVVGTDGGARKADARVVVCVRADTQPFYEAWTDGLGRASLWTPPDTPVLVRVTLPGHRPAETGPVRAGDGPVRIVLVEER